MGTLASLRTPPISRRSRPARRARALIAGAAVLLVSQSAEAAPPTEPTEPGTTAPATVVWHPWQTFDPHLSRREVIFSAGPVLARSLQEQDGRGGFDATFG